MTRAGLFASENAGPGYVGPGRPACQWLVESFAADLSVSIDGCPNEPTATRGKRTLCDLHAAEWDQTHA